MSSINEMVERMPLEIKNKILTYRQAHPLTELMRQAKETEMEAVVVDDEDLTYGSFTEMTCASEEEGVFKTLLWNIVDEGLGNWSGYCDRVRQDYEQIYLSYGVYGIWDDEMETRLQLNKQKSRVDELLCNIRALAFN